MKDIVVKFVDKLNSLIRLGNQDMLNLNLEPRYIPINLNPVDNAVESENVILYLINTYSGLEDIPLNYLSFFNKIEQNSEYSFFGFNSVHNLKYGTSKNGVVKVFDAYQNRIAFSVAKNELLFLKAIIRVMDLEKLYFEKDKRSFDNEFKKELALECASIAGGAKYLDFYTLIIGVSNEPAGTTAN